VARVVSLVSLVATILPPVLFFYGALTLASTQTWMLGATVAWFAATPVWMDRDHAS
jgi:hypothetical protein